MSVENMRLFYFWVSDISEQFVLAIVLDSFSHYPGKALNSGAIELTESLRCKRQKNSNQ